MPSWLDVDEVEDLHEVALDPPDQSGRNPGSDLRGAIARPRNWYKYRGVDDITRLAALYGVAIAKAHAFLDGNKRTALLAVHAFLYKNGFLLDFDEDSVRVDKVFEQVAAGEMGCDELAAWLDVYTHERAY